MSGVCSPMQASGTGGGLVPGEFLLTDRDFRDIAAMIHADAGIHLPESKAALVYSRLAKRLRALGLANFHEYCRLVATSEGLDERQKMLAALTTNVTRFFREPHHFDHLERKILPPLIEAARRGGRLRFWSSACSSGQEPYSIALTLLSVMPDAGKYDIKVLATDIDPNMLAAGRRGTYTEDDVAPVPVKLRARWFAPVRNGRLDHVAATVEAAAGLRELVVFRELNLFGPWPMKGHFQAIFCRNAAIYFDEPAQEQLWSRFAPKLSPDGVIYVGHSERITGAAAKVFQAEGATIYRLRQGRGA
ncbi:MAG TPA: protein-glutamate O-methyltransferase [Methylocella sp.]|nr:protein-glutamate O-methyltransferase [Methylocella sp.]